MTAPVFVTGGAGYIGSHIVRALVAAGREVVVFDDLSSGHPEAVPAGVPLVVADLSDVGALRRTIREWHPAAAVHLAGAIEPGLSGSDPRRFYRTNVVGTLNLLDELAPTRTPLVFSSSCSVYGTPERLPVDETAPFAPESVYGRTKAIGEGMLVAYDEAYGLRSISLRYFNAAGAAANGDIGADHRYKIHLVTVACLAALGRVPEVEVFGDDYPTSDGTCERDYIHVEDLAAAHVVALDALAQGATSTAYNVGAGRAYSVRQVLETVEAVTGRPVPARVSSRRPGDPVAVWADTARIHAELGWKAARSSLEEIVSSAWRWHRTHPDGFAPSQIREAAPRAAEQATPR
jgi:UDP-glucose 4-epimerase